MAQLPVVRAPAPRPQVALRRVEVPSPEALGIQLAPEAVVVPDPSELGIKLD